MTSIWKKLSLALSAMIVGSLVTTVVLTWPESLKQAEVVAQEQLSAPGTRAPLDQHSLSAAFDLSNAFHSVAEAMP